MPTLPDSSNAALQQAIYDYVTQDGERGCEATLKMMSTCKIKTARALIEAAEEDGCELPSVDEETAQTALDAVIDRLLAEISEVTTARWRDLEDQRALAEERATRALRDRDQR